MSVERKRNSHTVLHMQEQQTEAVREQRLCTAEMQTPVHKQAAQQGRAGRKSCGCRALKKKDSPSHRSRPTPAHLPFDPLGDLCVKKQLMLLQLLQLTVHLRVSLRQQQASAAGFKHIVGVDYW